MANDPNAFIAAVAKDDVSTVQQTIQARPTWLGTALDDRGRSPLHVAAQHDARRVAELLVKSNADFYARDANGQLALDLPPGQEMNDTRRWLRTLNQARNEFLDAVHERKVDRVKGLLAADPTLANARDIGDGWTAVMLACHLGDVEVLRVLIAAGADLAGTDFNSGQDAVQVCAERGQADCLGLLLAAGADATRTWRIGYGSLPMEMNALHVAAWKGHGEVVRRLLSAKLDPNVRARSYAMFSPLHFAATEGHTEIVQQLLAAGADVTARDGRRGISALDMATAGKHEATAALLQGR